MSSENFQNQRPLPRHVAIIMDGNGRWAQQRGLPRVAGHQQGAESVRDIVRASREIGIKALTLFAFSEQNWDRPEDEVEALMGLLYQYVLEEHDEIMQNSIRLTTIGDIERLPFIVRKALTALMEISAKNSEMLLCLALSYSSQRDLLKALRRLVKEVLAGRLKPEALDAPLLEQHLATANLPPLDLLIRTSGEFRLSDFLLWEAAFAELYFTPTMWPEFRRQHLDEALAAYHARERRFGLISEQLPQASNQ
jgi:undecaprenyl diphosphate synthase